MKSQPIANICFFFQFQWQNILAKKPFPGVFDPTEVESLELAKNAIGNFVLKSDPENISIEQNPENSTMAKYSELKRLREDIQQMKRDFNAQVFVARQQKSELCHYVKEKLMELEGIQVEIPADHIKTVAMIPSIDENIEYLDRKFDTASLIVSGQTPVSKKTGSIIDVEAKSDFYQAILQMNTTADNQTKFGETETELRQLRLTWKLFEQDTIIDEIDKRISAFDAHLMELKNRRLETALDVYFMELYYFTVYQELIVLKNFEKSQKLLMQDIDDGRCERGRIESKTASEKSALHELQQHINGLKESLNSVERRFDDLQGDDESASISEMVFRCGGMEKSQVVQSLSVAYSCFCTNLTRQFALQEIQIQIVAAIYLNQFLVSSVCQTPICQPSRFDGQNRCRNAIKCFFYLFSRFGRNATVNIQLAVT